LKHTLKKSGGVKLVIQIIGEYYLIMWSCPGNIGILPGQDHINIIIILSV